MKTRTNKKPPATKPPALEPPTFEDVRRVVLAWLVAEHPHQVNVELTIMSVSGCSIAVFPILEAVTVADAARQFREAGDSP